MKERTITQIDEEIKETKDLKKKKESLFNKSNFAGFQYAMRFSNKIL